MYQEEEAEWIIWIVHLLLLLRLFVALRLIVDGSLHKFPAILKTSLELGVRIGM